jgi:outer membrane protein assembly factor BamB
VRPRSRPDRPPASALLAALLAAALVAACSSGSGHVAARSGSGTTGASGPNPATSAGPGGGVTTSTAAVAAQAPPGTWAMFGHDSARTGVDTQQPAYAALRHLWSTPSLDGDVYGQPLIVGATIVAATEADTVYAFATADGRELWHTNLGSPVPGGDLPCGDIDPSGITSTPVIDPATNTVLVVAFTQPAHHDLVALDLASGAVRWRRAVDPPGSDPGGRAATQRPAPVGRPCVRRVRRAVRRLRQLSRLDRRRPDRRQR